jgi:hypothetical protein
MKEVGPGMPGRSYQTKLVLRLAAEIKLLISYSHTKPQRASICKQESHKQLLQQPSTFHNRVQSPHKVVYDVSSR